MRKLQTVRDLATLFQRHENTIYKWIVDDRLFPNAFRIKRELYVPLCDVERVIRQGCAAANHQALLERPPSASPR